MDQAIYRYYVDWNADGDFGDAYEEISDDVLSASWERGASSSNAILERDRAGACRIILDNSSSKYSSFYSSSPIYGSILPNIRVRITMQIGAGPETTEWQGFLDSIIPKVGAVVGISTAELSGLGALAHPMLQQLVTVQMKTGIRTGAAINYVLDSIGWPAGERAIDTGQSTMRRWWISGQVTAYQAIMDIVDTETGWLRESKDGKIVFEDRAHRLNPPHTVSQATYASGAVGALYIWDPVQEDALRGIYNYIEAQIRTFDLSEDVVLWTLTGTPPAIAPSATSVFKASLYTPGQRSNYVAVNSWGIIDLWANSQADGNGTDLTQYINPSAEKTDTECIITLQNMGGTTAYITLLRCHGTAVVESDPVTVFSEDATSQAQFGLLKYPIRGRFFTDITEGQNRCDHLLTIMKDPRPKLTFTQKANYDSDHLADAQDRDLSDRVTIDAGAPYGLYVNADFFIEWMQHNVDSAGLHTMKMLCVSAVTHDWAASSPAYTPETIQDEGPPDDLETKGIDPLGRIIIGVAAWKWNKTIDKAEIRAKLITGDAPEYVDLRTPAEGGTLVHNGTTELIFSDYAATFLGTNIQFQTDLEGRWYFASRLHNLYGWSVWSDGNTTPARVTDYVLVEGPIGADAGPAGSSVVSISMKNGAVVVSATRPSVNSKNILSIIVQLRNANEAGSWYDVDADTGAAETEYDGSGADHIYNQKLGTLTKASGDWGTAAPGDLLLIDVRNNSSFDVQYCAWLSLPEGGIVDDTTLQHINGIWMDADPDSGDDIWQHVRCKIVKAPWKWDDYGYLAEQGYWQREFYWGDEYGDKTTSVFVSDPIQLPPAMVMGNIVARVWLQNKVCISDVGQTTRGTIVDTGNPSGASNLEIITHAIDPSVSPGMMVLQWNRDTVNYNNIFVCGFWVSSAIPAEGPYYVERAANPSCVIESGTCTITGGDVNVSVTRSADPAVVGRVLLIYTNDADPDSDLDGNVIAAEGVNSLTLDMPFYKSGSFDYEIVKRWWDVAGGDTSNLSYIEFIVPDEISGDVAKAVWRTPEVPLPATPFYISGGSRNPFGVGTRMFAYSGTTTSSGYCITLAEADPLVLDCSLINGTRKVFRVVLTGSHTLQAINGVCGQPIVLLAEQGTGGNHTLTLDTMFRTGMIPIIWSTLEASVDYIGIMCYAPHGKYDVVSWVPNYKT